jgi:uncharacterized protein (DUF1684 family)
MTMRAARLMVALLAVGAVACSSGPPPPPSATEALRQVEEQRAATERFMRESKESPIPPDKVDVLLPLRYYEPSPAYRVPAQLRLSDQRPVAEMPTSTGTMMRYERVGVLQFTLDGEEHSLGAFVPEGTRNISELFVPFADSTTGTETYSSGRYLNLEPTGSGFYTIDFNYAYNPYCAYNKQYVCPFPPPSNRLKIPILAGEKTPPAT